MYASYVVWEKLILMAHKDRLYERKKQSARRRRRPTWQLYFSRFFFFFFNLFTFRRNNVRWVAREFHSERSKTRFMLIQYRNIRFFTHASCYVPVEERLTRFRVHSLTCALEILKNKKIIII